MANQKKYLTLVEAYLSRYQRGGFQVGDLFKFNDKFKSLDCYKKLGDNTKQMLDQMIELVTKAIPATRPRKSEQRGPEQMHAGQHERLSILNICFRNVRFALQLRVETRTSGFRAQVLALT